LQDCPPSNHQIFAQAKALGQEFSCQKTFTSTLLGCSTRLLIGNTPMSQPHSTAFSKPDLKTVLGLSLLAIFLLMEAASAYLADAQSTVSQSVTAEWSKTFVGFPISAMAVATNIVQTSDSGFAMVVDSAQLGPHWGCLLVKLGSNGTLQWNRTFTGNNDIDPLAFVKTSDGGYAITGIISYYAGSTYVRLAWFLKTDVQGNAQWTKTYGDSSGVFEARALTLASDGGYVIAGDYASYAGKNGWQGLLIKTDSAGNTIWNKTYGELHDHRFRSIVHTADGDFVMAGDSGSTWNIPRFWLVKTDSAGTMQWSKTYGDSWDVANSVIQTNDGGFALAGSSTSQPNNGNDASFWLVKTDADGNIQWDRSIGQTSWGANNIIQTADGGYALSGASGAASATDFSTFGRDLGFNLAKTDASGNLQWTYGENGKNAMDVIQTSDGGYALAGISNQDFWVSKIDAEAFNRTSTSIPNINPDFTTSTGPTLQPSSSTTSVTPSPSANQSYSPIATASLQPTETTTDPQLTNTPAPSASPSPTPSFPYWLWILLASMAAVYICFSLQSS
jgi:hypothetical protein